MKSIRYASILAIYFLILPTLCFALPWKHSLPRHEKYVPGEILVQFRKGAPADKIIKEHGASVKEVIPRINVYRLRLPKGKTIEEAQAEFSRNPHVNFASPNHIIHADLFPNDELFFLQWGLYNSYGRCDIHAPEAWDINTGSDSIIIAIIDTGIDSSHPDLAGKIVAGYNAIDGSSNTEDDHMHGTFVSGIAAAWGDDYTGIAGVNWNALLMPIKVLNADGYGEEADAAEGIIWAVEHGAKVINMSIGTYLHVPALESAVNEAWAAGCVLTAASGNDGLDDRTDPHYPSYYPATISVGATNEYDMRCTAADWGEGGSNYGDSLDVMAPGNFIISSVPWWYWSWLFDGYEILSGTSASTPFVSGLAALIWSAHPDWTNQQVRDQIEQTCDDIGTTGWDRYTGWGRINAYRALSEAFETYSTIGELWNAEIGEFVKLSAKPVTAGTAQFGDRFYIEEPDRSAGIMVYYGQSVTTPTSIGDLVEVAGELYTAKPEDFPNGELAIINPRVTIVGNGITVAPLGISNKDVGGQELGYRGITGGIGLPNTGLLVKTWGKVTSVGRNFIYIDDGSNLDDGSGLTGLKVYTAGTPSVKKNDFVSVTGISTIEIPAYTEIRIPVIRARQPADIKKLN